nr:DNA repair protein RadC [Roseomonas acroporae]
MPLAPPQVQREESCRRLLKLGGALLPDGELLALLLANAAPGRDVRPLAAALLARFGSFAAVLAAPLQELRGIPGIEIHALAAIRLTHEAALRLARSEVMRQTVLDHWDALMRYLNAALARERIEQFRILFLDAESRLLADEAQARGTVNHTPVYPREVVRRALELRATALILVHNHPSGDPTPSQADLDMTAEVRDAAALLGIVVQDHVIVGNGRWLSFRTEGLL